MVVAEAPQLVIDSDQQFAAAMAELEVRKTEALYLYRPMLTQLPFHLSRASAKLVRGGQRAGKTLTWAAEIASAATGIPLRGPDGEMLPLLYPRKRPLLIWLIGYDERHIGRIYRKLFTACDFFRVLKDRETGELRAWRGFADPEDAAREDEAESAPALIPSRLVHTFTWEKRGEGVFTVCELTNGTRIEAYSSKAEAATGDPVDIVGIDERIEYPGHIAEWEARLSDRRGKLLWASWPRVTNPALTDMSERAEEQLGRENPDVEEFRLTFVDSPFIPKDEKRKRTEGWGGIGSPEYRARALGDYVTDLQMVFPEFSIDISGLPSKLEPKDRLEKFLEARNWDVPIDWTNFISIDPGHQKAAVIMASMPPPDLGDYLVVWAAFYGKQVSPDDLAELIKRRVGPRQWEAFVMDRRGGEQTGLGAQARARAVYADAFKELGISSRQTGHNFAMGLDHPNVRNMEVRKWLRPRHDGTYKLRLIANATRELQREFKLYSKRMGRDEVEDKIVKKNDDLIDALAYLVAFRPHYAIPERKQSPVLEAAQNVEKWFRRHQPQDDSVYLGPGVAPNYQDFAEVY